MATINAAAASRAGTRGATAAIAIVFAAGLAGCSSNGGNLLDGTGSILSDNKPAQQAPAVTTASRGKIAIAPVIGAPDAVAKQIATQLGTEAAKNRIAVARAPGETVDYTLRGYIVAARETTGTKVSYIWDVTNPAGARVHRITGEEVVKGAGTGDPWSSVSPQVIQTIALKTSQSLNTWMPQKTSAPQSPVATPPSAPQPIASSGGASRTPSSNVTTASTPRGAPLAGRPLASPAKGSQTRVATIGKPANLTAVVPRVVGAPGDGSTSLARALQAELTRNGVATARPGTPSYRVEGRVAMGKTASGQQPIKIDWVVVDPNGRKLGTVSQENQIPAGSLNGAWGSTANAAAVAAAQGILKLMPTKTASR